MSAFTLCINAGSSSVKYALFDEAFNTIDTTSERYEGSPKADARKALERYLNQLAAKDITLSDIKTCCHRFVFGGRQFPHAIAIDDPVLQQLDALVQLAPLHMPPALHFVEAATQLLPNAAMTGHFDTAFHHTIPKVNHCYALPHRYYEQGLCRFGFHGLSYKYISQRLKVLSAKSGGRWVVAHLGSGASLCGIKNGQSQICTMGFSPLDGLPMASRTGQIDPGVIIQLLRSEQMSIDALEQLLYKESGMLGLSGISGDWQALNEQTSAAARFAQDYFIEHTVQQIGKVVAHLQGIDGIVFTGGIGENDSACVAAITERLQWLGLGTCEFSTTNKTKSAHRLTPTNAAIEAWIIATDEAAVMAREASELQHP